jgi:hypothetical protein
MVMMASAMSLLGEVDARMLLPNVRADDRPMVPVTFETVRAHGHTDG